MKQKTKFSTKQTALCAIFLALIIVGAFIRVPIGTVPVTLQLFFVLLASQLLTISATLFCVLSYIALGLIGLPVFANGGGIGYVLQPSFGYLIGFVFCGLLVSYLSHKNKKQTIKKLFLINLIGCACIYLFALPFCWFLNAFYFSNELKLWPLIFSFYLVFVPSDIIFCLLSAITAKRIKPFLLN